MGEKILVLEDDAMFLAQVVDALEDDYMVVGCSTPEKALETAEKSTFDLLITDVRMAGRLDGIGVLGEIKQRCPSIYSIVMTGYTNVNSEVRAMQHGIDFYLHKPFRSTQFFLDTVAQVLATRSISATIQHQVKSFFASALRQVVGNKGTPAYLERERLLVFRGYYTGVQSGKLSLYGGITLWDQLVALESRYEELKDVVGPVADRLALDYRELLSRCQELTQSFTSANLPKREAEELPKEQFKSLYDRLQAGKVSLPLLLRAPSLWTYSRRPGFSSNAELVGLWNQLFGSDEKAQESRARFNQFMASLNK